MESHQKILLEKRVFLVKNMDLAGTMVLDQLVQDRVLSPEKLASMREKCTGNIQLSSALLDHLQQRPEEDWSAFIKCLLEHQHGHIVKHIEQEYNVKFGELYPKDDPTQIQYGCTSKEERPEHEHQTSCVGPNVTLLQQKMADTIKRQYDEIPLWTLHSDHVRVPMEDLYVNLVLVKHDIREELPLLSYKEIFRKARSRSTIFLSGDPGVGKSTFTKHMSVDWATVYEKEAKLKPNIEETFEAFHFVLPVFLRNVRPGQTFCDMIAEEYQLKRTEAEELCHYITKTEAPILIIVDGLDEYCEKTSEEITDLLYRKMLPHVTLLITSRFSAESFFADVKYRPGIEVSLRGFTKEGVQEYARKFFKDKKNCDGMIQEIHRFDYLEHLSHYPAVLLMMATMWGIKHQLPDSITGFYKEFVAFLFARLEKKQEQVAKRAKSTESILEKYHMKIMKLGQLATGNIKTQRIELLFHHDDVMNLLSSEDLKMGFLIEKPVFSREKLYLFLHKTVQEFLISFYIVHSDDSTRKGLLMKFCNSAKAFKESAVIRRFVAGLGGDLLQEQIHTLISGDDEEVGEMLTDLQLDHLAEHREAQIALSRVVVIAITDKYPGSHYVKYLTQEGRNVEKLYIRSYDVKQLRILQYLKAPQLTYLKLGGSGDARCHLPEKYITEALEQTLPHLPLTQLSCEWLRDPNLLLDLVKAIVQMPTIQHLAFDWTTLTGSPVKVITAWLGSSDIRSIGVPRCGLTLVEAMALIEALPRQIYKLDLSGNNLCGLASVKDQLTAIKVSSIQSLRMSRCVLGADDMMAVIRSLPDTLTDLDVSFNQAKDALLPLIDETLLPKQLTSLKLSGNKMSTDVERIIKVTVAEKFVGLQLDF